jgi:hypothetical protein
MSENDQRDISDKVESAQQEETGPDVQLTALDSKLLQSASCSGDISRHVPVLSDVVAYAGTDFWNQEKEKFAAKTFQSSFSSTLAKISRNRPA